MDVVVLEALDVVDSTRWRWRLTSEEGAFIADHEVVLDAAAAEYEGFADLYEFLRWRADPDDWPADEARWVERVGRWIGEHVLGSVGDALVDAAPVTVRVLVPANAEWLWSRPLELGHIAGEPLATQDVTVVFQSPDADRTRSRHVGKRPVGDRLRMLGVFSLPSGTSALALRRERHQLTRLIQEIATVDGRSIELQVVQYGVTRHRLREIIEQADGWDIIHFSGHGLTRGVLLERDDGTEDMVDIDELESLLRATREQLKLVTLSSCYSAADSAAATLQRLGITHPDNPNTSRATDRAATTTAGGGDGHGEQDGSPTRTEPAPVLPASGRKLANRLGCAVLAMRYPVRDDFAVRLSEGFYTRLLARGQPVTRALQLALPAAVAGAPSPGTPAASVATPGLFGAAAVDLRLPAPAAKPLVFDREQTKLAGFPAQSDRFVGRTGSMARASAALAPRSGRSGVVLHGMAGAGKTACAVELAHTHTDVFQTLVWYQAPTDDADETAIAASLTDLTLRLEQKLDGLALAYTVDNRERFAAKVDELTLFLARVRVLVVIDNIESLLTDRGEWRDPRWQVLVEALAANGGLSRVVLTTRWPPASLDERMLVEPIHALSRNEAVVLARQLPNLAQLIDGNHPAIHGLTGRKLAAQILAVVQGHPKLLELADADATDPMRLQQQLDSAADNWKNRSIGLNEFFTAGSSAADAVDYLAILDSWTRTATTNLPAAAHDLYTLLCHVEPDERHAAMIANNWPGLWRRLKRAGDPPDPNQLLDHLAARALISRHTTSGRGGKQLIEYRIHPAIAAIGRQHASQAFRTAVDIQLADFWTGVFSAAIHNEGGESSRAAVWAGSHAAPYLIVLEDWETATSVLERVLRRDRSAATVATVLPLLRRICAATVGTENQVARGVLANALSVIDPDEARAIYRENIDHAIDRDDFRMAAVESNNLAQLHFVGGRRDDALKHAELAIRYGRRAGVGPWTQLGFEVARLRLLADQGYSESVLAQLPVFEEQMASLAPDDRDDERVPSWEGMDSWAVQEGLYDVGSTAAVHLQRWEAALDYVQQTVNSYVERKASDLQIARTRFSAYGPLLRLGRVDDARTLILECLSVFQEQLDVEMLGMSYGALAAVEAQRENVGDAVELVVRALRYRYMVGDVGDIAKDHYNVAYYLTSMEPSSAQVIAHRLAAATLDYYAVSGELWSTLAALRKDLSAGGGAAQPPASFSDLCHAVEQTEGVRFSDLVERIATRDSDHDTTLASLVQLARDPAAAKVARHLQEWEPIIRALVVAADQDDTTDAPVVSVLDELATSDDWAALVAVLRRILAGERERHILLAGLDDIGTAIATAVLARVDVRHARHKAPESPPAIT